MSEGNGEGAATREVTRPDIVRMFVVGTIASVAGVALGLWIDWFPDSASTQAGPIDLMYDVLIILSVPIFVFVTTIVLFAAIRFRVRPGEEGLDGPPMHGNTRLEVIWTAIPSLIVVALCIYSAAVLTEIEKAEASQQKVTVYGQQFAWQFKYTAPNGKEIIDDFLWIKCTPTTSATGQGAPCKGPQVEFDIKAVDVIHSLWIPAMRMKQDAVPGITTHTRVNPNRLGEYPFVCTELCGIGHGTMRSTVFVVTPAQYAAWQAKKLAAQSG